MRDAPPLNVVIAGAGRAGLEAMFGLHRLARRRAQVTLLAPNEEFSNHALDVLLPFATSRPRRPSLRTLASAAGAEVHRRCVSSIDVDEDHVVTGAGETVAYDVLLVAIGAVQRASAPHSLCFGSDGSHEDGSLARRQADAAAEAIAAHAGVALEPAPIWPVLEGVLLTERDTLLMRCEADGAGDPPEVLRRGSPGWPPPKIAGRELALHLDAAPLGTAT